MPRQPLSSRFPKSGFSFGAGFLAQRPRAAAKIAECIAGWTEVELQTGRVLAALLKTDTEPGLTLYFTLRNERAKADCLAAIAEKVLVEEALVLFRLIIKARRSVVSQRNDLAHGVLGITDCDPSGILWMSTDDRIRNMIESDKSFAERGFSGRTYDSVYSQIAPCIWHYNFSDLEEILSDIADLHRIIYRLVGVALQPKSQPPAELCSEPFLQRFL